METLVYQDRKATRDHLELQEAMVNPEVRDLLVQ